LGEPQLALDRAFEGWKPMAKHRTHSIEFKRQVAQEFLAGETLHRLAKRHLPQADPGLGSEVRGPGLR
jgi:hypothetical protein